MKKFLYLALTLLPCFAFGQTTAGQIQFTETIQLKIELPEGDESMKNLLPSAQSFPKVLYFNENAFLYRDEETKEEQEDATFTSESNGATFKMVIARPDNQLYGDLNTGATTESKEFFGKRFLIKGDGKNLEWKLTGEQKQSLGYTCFKAELNDTSRTVIAWFTPQIPVSAGPSGFGQLPGMILELDIDNATRTVKATSVSKAAPTPAQLVAPDKGKELTQAEFDQIVEEKTKEMQAEMGGDGKGGMHIIIRRN